MLQELEIDRKSGKPVSSQVADFVRAKIVNRELKPGERLPSTNDLVKFSGLGSQTIRTAMIELEAEGLIESSRGRGTFVKSDSKDNHIKKLAILGAFSEDKNFSEILYPNTLAGAFSECEKRNISAHIVPPYLSLGSPKDVLKVLKSEKCQGVLWFFPSTEDVDTLKYLKDFGVPVVISSQSGFARTFSCVECDELHGGHLLAEYFLEHHCPKVYVASEIITEKDDVRRHGSNGGSAGFRRGLCDSLINISGKSKKDVFEEWKLPYLDISLYKTEFKRHLQRLMPGDGILIENSYVLHEALLDSETCELLSKLTIGVISIEAGLPELRPLSSITQFKVLVLPVQKIGQAMVQKLLLEDLSLLTQSLTYLPVELKDSQEIFKS